MPFKLPKASEDYFKLINDKFKYKFDIYYLCLMLGLQDTKLGLPEEVKTEYFIDYYPEPYADKAELITGLLINAEMERLDIESQDRGEIERLILQLIDNNSHIKLSDNGMKLLNCYAAGGMQLIREKIPKTGEIETFYVLYHELINSESEAVSQSY